MSLELRLLKSELEDALSREIDVKSSWERSGDVVNAAISGGIILGLKLAINKIDIRLAQNKISLEIDELLNN